MQNISLTKIANAVARLECDNIRTEPYLQMITKHNSEIQDMRNELQKLQTVETERSITNKTLSDLIDTVDELKQKSTKDSVIDNTELVNKIQDQVQALKDDIIKTINESPILTYDEHEKNEHDSSDNYIVSRETNEPEFKVISNENNKYSNCSTLEDVMEIKMSNSSFSINTDESEREICSISNEIGGLAFRKNGSDDVWLLDRNKDSEMEFHFNSMSNIPLSINPRGVRMSNMSLNGKTISKIASAINSETINDNTIPTVNAIVKYINSNLQRMNLLNKLTENKHNINITTSASHDGVKNVASTDNTTNSTPDNTTAPDTTTTDNTIDTTEATSNTNTSEASIEDNTNASATRNTTTIPQCNISSINTKFGNSLLVENESNSISLKDNEFNVVTISASANDGLIINDTFKLKNNIGTLCVFKSENNEPMLGRFVELTGSYIKLNELIVPEVKLTNKLTSMVYGVINNIPKNEYVYNNEIYVLNSEMEYVTVINKGFMEIQMDECTFEIGSLLVAGRLGVPTLNKNNDAIRFCIDKRLPMVKVISIDNNKLISEIV